MNQEIVNPQPLKQTVKYTAVEKGNKWTVKDIILTVVLSAVAIAVMTVLNMATMGNYVINLIFTMGLVFFFMSPFFVFAAIKVNKSFVMLVFFALYIIFNLFSFWYSMIPLLATILLIELFMRKKDSYKTRWKLVTAYGIVGAGAVSTSYVIFLVWGTAQETMLAQGMTQEYLDTYHAWYTNPGIALGVYAFTVFCCVTGSFISYNVLKKHFEKTGIL